MDSKLSSDTIQGSVAENPLILAVDEDEDNILVISYLIKSLACRLITASKGELILPTAKKYLPDLILLEIILSDADGFRIIKRLKQDKLTQNIPIIVITRWSGTRARERIESAGCIGYLCKPYLFEDLEALIHPHLKEISKRSAFANQEE